MIRFTILPCLVLVAMLAGCATPEGPATRLEKANVLPLALDDSYAFRKILQSTLDPQIIEPRTTNEPILFERARRSWGAIEGFEYERLYGNHYTIFWRNSAPADVTLRLEYRQAGLGNYVLAQERFYPNTRGSHRATFDVAGDDFLENGRVSAWRALLIVDGKIVALTQSYMWR
jgi:hypothetical protein